MTAAARFWKKIRRSEADPCLYIYPFSIQSIVVQFTIVFALRGKSRPTRELSSLGYRLVNIERNENLREWYLLNVNPLGRVPTLTSKSFPSPLTDSLGIVYWICDQYPALLPKEHQTEICRLLSELNDHLDGLSSPNPAVEDFLTSHDITPAHRQALEYKRDRHRKQREIASMNLSDGYSMTKQTTAFLTEIVQLRDKYSKGGTWIFGNAIGPTVLDAHVVPFIARLRDISLEELVPEQLARYADRILASSEWKEVMGQRATVWDPSMGPIDELRM
ncbi:hypothetical protein BJY04DRAFT_206436 [Aspergillus karnatakaensis]|uniref:glutathione S-transferase family protein n=1 Tax=Aspergillus karnatakaensis TaxID=1810916 RepID=UPI003CCD0A69